MAVWLCEGTCIYMAVSTLRAKPKEDQKRYRPCTQCCGYRVLRRRKTVRA